MRLAPALGFALHASAAALLSVALLDFLAYEFAFVDLVAEMRPGSVHRWPGPTRSVPGRGLLVLALIAVTAALGALALARVRRTAGALLTLAAACTGAQLTVAVAVAWFARGQQLAGRLVVDPHTSLVWLDRGRQIDSWDSLHVQSVVGALASASILATALAGVRMALHRGWSPARAWLTGALALPPLLATGALTRLWDAYGTFRPPGWRHEDWAALAQSARWTIVAAALVVAAAAALLLRGRPRPRLLPAAGLGALGLAAVVVTAPHRRAIDALYPLPIHGAHSLMSVRLRAPWELDARVTPRCMDGPDGDNTLVVRVDATGAVTANFDGFPISLDDPPEVVRAEFANHLRFNESHQFIVLVADRRTPIAALMPLFELLPRAEIGRVVVAGLVAAELLTAEGPVIGWRGCVIGVLQFPTFMRTTFAPGATWGAVLDDPALVPALGAP